MLEIISLLIITRLIAPIAEVKGLNVKKWKMLTIFLFLFLEFIGCIIGLLLFGQYNLISTLILAFAFGITSYPIIKNYLSKLPDQIIEDNEFE